MSNQQFKLLVTFVLDLSKEAETEKKENKGEDGEVEKEHEKGRDKGETNPLSFSLNTCNFFFINFCICKM